jgi:hypothetical protein
MHSVEYNLALLKEIMEEFEGYLLSEVLFWPLSRKSYENIPFPQLSLGTLQLTLDELSAQRATMDPDQEGQFQILLGECEKSFRRWRVVIEKKAAREAALRKNLWRAYLQDVEEEPDALLEYAYQVRNRVLISKLEALSGSSNSTLETKGFDEIDEKLLVDASPDEFIWDEKLKPIYPFEEFPFLYLKPSEG